MELGNVSKGQQNDRRVKKADEGHNGSSTQQDNPAPGGELQLAPKQKYIFCYQNL